MQTAKGVIARLQRQNSAELCLPARPLEEHNQIQAQDGMATRIVGGNAAAFS